MPGFTWSSIFGQIYSDLGLLSFVYMLGYGIVAALLWKLMLQRRVFGILLYPWMGFSIIMWVGDDLFVSQDLSLLIFTGIIFTFFEKIFIRK